MSNSLWPHGLQHKGSSVLHCLPEFTQLYVHWVADISKHLIVCHLLLLWPLIFPSIRVFSSESALCIRWPKSIGALASASVPPINIQGWFPLGFTGLVSLFSKGLSRVFSRTTIQRHQFFGAQPSLWSNSQPYITTGKAIDLTMQTCVGKVMFLLFNTLSRCVIAFHPMSILWGSGCTGSRIFCHLEFIWFQSVYVVSLGYAILLKVVTHSLPSCVSFSHIS